MSKIISYICNRCNSYVNIENGDDCKCVRDTLHVKEFQPFYSDECQTMITSQRQMEKVYKQHGLVCLGDMGEKRRQKAYILKHREDYIQEKYAKAGMKYKPGSNVRVDRETFTHFVPANRH